MGGMSLSHWLILAVILLLFFGPNKISDVAKSLGKGIRGFKDGLNQIDVEAKEIPHENQDQSQQEQVARAKEKSENKKS